MPLSFTLSVFGRVICFALAENYDAVPKKCLTDITVSDIVILR